MDIQYLQISEPLPLLNARIYVCVWVMYYNYIIINVIANKDHMRINLKWHHNSRKGAQEFSYHHITVPFVHLDKDEAYVYTHMSWTMKI